jgi:hypothetical protein
MKLEKEIDKTVWTANVVLLGFWGALLYGTARLVWPKLF